MRRFVELEPVRGQAPQNSELADQSGVFKDWFHPANFEFCGA